MRNKKQFLRDYRENGIANCLPEISDQPSAEAQVVAGRIKMFDRDRGFGFLLYDDPAGIRQEVFFHVSGVVEGEPVQRAKVTFELKTDDRNGRTIAGNIRIDQHSVQQIPGCRAQVIRFDMTRRFGFLRDSDGRLVFAHLEEILPNAAGHRCFILMPGTEVIFTLNEHVDRTENKFFASDVHLAQDNIVPDRLEYSRVARWSRDHQHGILNRSCGCKLSFKAENVVTEGIQFIRVNDWVQHTTATDGKDFFASNVTLFEEGFEPPIVYEPGSAEAAFLAAADLPTEPELPVEPTPAPVPAEPAIYSSAERKLTLRELIAAKKRAA